MLTPQARAVCALAALLLAGTPSAADEAVFLGSFHWTDPRPHFGGVSGFEVIDGGARYLAVSDKAQVLEGAILRENGRIVAIEAGGLPRLRDEAGEKLEADGATDAEGLALLPGGRFAVSFEHGTRVRVYAAPHGPAEALALHPDFARLWANGGLEALAAGPDGTFYTVPERPPWPWETRQVYRFTGGAWQTFGTLATSGFWAPVGADVGPDGRFYLLERRYLPILGFASRVRRFGIGTEGLEDGEVLLESRFGRHDNLEGIAVWQAAEGGLRVTMVSDDNFSRRQRTEVVEYAVPGAVDRPARTR